MLRNNVLYTHSKPCGEVFYVGIGKNRRPYSKHSRNPLWLNVVSKYSYNVIIVEDNLTWDEACQKEIELIAHYGRRDLGEGTLVNMTDGGDGVANLSKETTEKIIEKTKKFNFTKEQLEYIYYYMTSAEIASVYGFETSTVKKLLTKYQIKKDKSRIKRRPFSENCRNSVAKKVICTETGTIYNSVASASRELGFKESTLRHQLLGTYTNNTSLIFLKNDYENN